MRPWFTTDRIDRDTYCISEYRHWEETHCYLLSGAERSLLIDTGLGICDIADVVSELTALPVTAVATHIHWDHIGGHKFYPDFYAHAAELPWLQGGFPQTIEEIRGYVTERCALPEGYDVGQYTFFQGTPTEVLHGGERIELGGRTLEVLHTPGHMCFWEAARGYLFTGDLIYKGTLTAWFPSADPEAYLHSVEQVAALPAGRILPAHHSLDIRPELVLRVRDQLRRLKKSGALHHGSGTFDYGDWAIQL